MEKQVCDFILSKIKKESYGINIFSREYFFTKKYAKHRNVIIYKDSNRGFKTRLSFLIRDGLTEEQRKSIFPSVFDLGNHKVVPPELCTYDELANELYSNDADGVNANDAFETIQKTIFEITGRKIKIFSDTNKSKTYKVLKTLKYLMKDQSSQSLMQLLKSPDQNKKFSLSFRDVGPYEKNEDQVFQIADLSAYLSAELSDERFYLIKNTFFDLNDRCNEIVFSVERELVGRMGKNYERVIQAYDNMRQLVDDFKVTGLPVSLDLDEELFIHINRLEYSHFAVGFQQLIEVAIPKCRFNFVNEELKDFTIKSFPNFAQKVKETDPLLSLGEVSNFILKWHLEINRILEKAAPENFKLHDLKKINANVKNLLRFYYYFRSMDAGNLNEQVMQVSPWKVIAAACCVNYSLNFGLNFKPYWHGQPAQGGSINSSISKAFGKIGFADDNVPEEHRTILLNCFDMIADAMRGHSELRERRFAFQSSVVRKVLEISSTNDMNRIAENLNSLADFVNEAAVDQ